MVMYAGQVVERATTRALFREMRHPYTEALMGSIPRTRDPSHTRLRVIPGRPAAVIDPPPGCRFAPRCRYAQAKCLVEEPALTGPPDRHQHACFFPVGTPQGRAALADNVRAGQTAAGLPVSDDEARDGR
jgi:peptide/nickel transport system ATP-binding protein